MKVAHITSVHPRFDIRIFHKECKTLANNGHEVFLVVADGKGSQVDSGIDVVDVGAATGGRVLRILKSTRKVIDKVRELKPDVVHLHDPELLPGGLKLAKEGYKVIYDVHEDVPRQILAKHWIPALVRRPLSAIFEPYENFVAARMTAIVGATPLIRDRFYESNRCAVDVCNFPIIDELVRDFSWDDRKDEICYVGDITRIRGIVPLIGAAAKAGTRLNLAGSWIDDGLRNELVNGSGWSYVNEYGFVGRDEIANILHRSRIGMVTLFENPNDMDSLPIKMFEYMAAGLPVIASDYPAWRKIIDGAGCGVLVNPHDVDEIAEAIGRLLSNPKEAMEMGIRGRDAVLKRFSWEKESQKLLSLYDQISK